MIYQIMKSVRKSINIYNNPTNQTNISEVENHILESLILPFAEIKGNTIIKPMNNNKKRILIILGKLENHIY